MKLKEFLNEIFIEKARNDKEMLRISIIAELDAANLYEGFAEKTENEEIKKVMLSVAKEEKVHAGEFEALLKMIDPEFMDAKNDGYKEVSQFRDSEE